MSAHAAVEPAGPERPARRAPGRRRSQGFLDQTLLESVRESVMADASPVTPSRVAAAVQAARARPGIEDYTGPVSSA